MILKGMSLMRMPKTPSITPFKNVKCSDATNNNNNSIVNMEVYSTIYLLGR